MLLWREFGGGGRNNSNKNFENSHTAGKQELLLKNTITHNQNQKKKRKKERIVFPEVDKHCTTHSNGNDHIGLTRMPPQYAQYTLNPSSSNVGGRWKWGGGKPGRKKSFNIKICSI